MLTRPNVAASKYNLALLRRQRNETDIARQLFRECEQIYFTVYGPDHSKQIYASVYGPDHRSTLACTDLTTARRWMQHGKLVVVCSDTAQITKISQTTKENAFSTFQSINLLLFLQKQNLATAIYLFGLGTLLPGPGLKHMR